MIVRRNNPDAPRLGFEPWTALFRSTCGSYTLESAEPDVFAGWVRALNLLGFSAVEVTCNESRIDRTRRDLRLDGADLYGAIFQMAGRLKVSHNNQTIQLDEGDLILVDKTQPASYSVDNKGAHFLCLQFPRRGLISQLGFEPQGASHKCSGRTPAGRLLVEAALHALERDAASPSADSYMQLAVYDLVGALFAPDLWSSSSRHTDKLFARMQNIVRDRFTDPDFGPHELAADAGISLRYVHKLFAQRGMSCREFIYSLRLDHAARLLNRQQGGKTTPLNEIAYICGFREYTHFARKFRHRFGFSPKSYPSADVPAPEQPVRG